MNQGERHTMLGDYADVDRTDGSDLVERLDAMRTLDMFRRYKRETFDLMRLNHNQHSRAADIGCGTGEDARALVDCIGDAGHVTGFDVSETMLAEARRRHADALQKLTFVQAPAESLPSTNEVFDAVRADRVLIHAPSPRNALIEALRVLRPGGRLVVSEPDMESCWMSTNGPAVAARVFGAIARSCQHPVLARDLYHLFQELGLQDVVLDLRPIIITDPEPVEQIMRFRATVEALIQSRQLDADEGQAWLTELRERQARRQLLAGITIFIVSGTKPL